MREFFSMGVVVSALELLQNGGEFILLGIWGILLAVCRRRVFRSVCREAALEGGEKGRMLRAMTLKFQKSYEVWRSATGILLCGNISVRKSG